MRKALIIILSMVKAFNLKKYILVETQRKFKHKHFVFEILLKIVFEAFLYKDKTKQDKTKAFAQDMW